VMWAKYRPRYAREVEGHPSVVRLIFRAYLGGKMGEIG